MSHNTVRARASFSFQGEVYNVDTVINLDDCVGEPGVAPDFHRVLGKAAGIDPYSYLYEVFESHEIAFSDATGVAARSCDEGRLDWQRFVHDVGEVRDWQVVREIAEAILGARDWEADAALKSALLATYRAGKTAGL